MLRSIALVGTFILTTVLAFNEEAIYNYDGSKSNQLENLNEEGYGRHVPNAPFETGYVINCLGDDKVCVTREDCTSDGFTTPNAIFKREDRKCEINREVCCTLRSEPEYVSGASDAVGIFTEPRENNGYLPPEDKYTDANNFDPVIIAPGNQLPPEESGSINLGPEVSPIQYGCAAALKCVEEQFCSAAGVISRTPLTFTPQQLMRRVPMVDCRDPDTQIVGKCCRDPDYTDPWPTGTLPPNDTPVTRRPIARPVTRPLVPVAPFSTSNPVTRPSPLPSLVINTIAPSINPPPTPPRVLSTLSSATLSSETRIPPRQFNSFAPITRPRPPTPAQQVFISTLPEATRGTPEFLVQSTNVKDFVSYHQPGSQCGLVNKVLNRPSHLGEIDAAWGEIPWQAMILNKAEKKLICSGVIIDKNIVLTSGSCVEGLEAEILAVKAGEWKLGYELLHEEPLNYTIVNVQHVIRHPNYVKGGASFDLAILYLEVPFVLDQHIDVICLGEEQPQLWARQCIVTGWGKDIVKYHVSGALMHKIDVDIISDEEAKERIALGGEPLDYDQSFVSGKAHRPDVSMCQVDIGGPLACDRGDGHYELVGIYARDNGCQINYQVSVFSIIDIQWVRQVILQPSYWIKTIEYVEAPVEVVQEVKIPSSAVSSVTTQAPKIIYTLPPTPAPIIIQSTTTAEPDCECNKRKLAAAALLKAKPGAQVQHSTVQTFQSQPQVIKYQVQQESQPVFSVKKYVSEPVISSVKQYVSEPVISSVKQYISEPVISSVKQYQVPQPLFSQVKQFQHSEPVIVNQFHVTAKPILKSHGDKYDIIA